MTPQELFEQILDKAMTLWDIASIEAGAPPIDEEIRRNVLRPAFSMGINAAAEYFAQHPEYLALAGRPRCAVCHGDVETWEIGPSYPDGEGPTKVALPCNHRQPETEKH